MPTQVLPAGDGTTKVFNTVVPFSNGVPYVDGLAQPPSFFTLVGTTLTFLPAANFQVAPADPAAPVPGANIWITGDISVRSTAGITTARDYSSNELIASVQQRAFIPLAARDFGPAQILRLFNEEIDGYLVPFVAQRRLEFWVESTDATVTGGVAAIPSVAMGGKLRAVAYMVGGIPFLLDQVDLPVAVASPLVPLSVQYPSKYYFMGPNVILWPTPSLNGTLRIYYYRRPSVLVLPSQCVQVASFPGGAPAGYYRIGFTGPLPSSYAVNIPVDLVSAIPNFTLYANSLPIHATDSSTYIELPGTLPTGLVLGDWLCLYNTAPVVVGAPADLLNMLVQEVALKVSEAKGTDQTVARLAAGLRAAENSAGWTIQQRNDGAMRKVSAFPQDSLAWPYPWGGA